MSCAYRISSAVRSRSSRNARPESAFTEAIMTAGAPLESRFDQLTGHGRRDGQVAYRVELREAGPQPGIVAQPDHEIPAGGRGPGGPRGAVRRGGVVPECAPGTGGGA